MTTQWNVESPVTYTIRIDFGARNGTTLTIRYITSNTDHAVDRRISSCLGARDGITLTIRYIIPSSGHEVDRRISSYIWYV